LAVEPREDRIDALEKRTRRFALDVIKACSRVPMGSVQAGVARQLGRAAGSVAANHRAVRRARSTKEFAAKLQIVNEEIDEVTCWLDLLHESGLVKYLDLAPLIREAREIRAIFAAARRTTRSRMEQ